MNTVNIHYKIENTAIYHLKYHFHSSFWLKKMNIYNEYELRLFNQNKYLNMLLFPVLLIQQACNLRNYRKKN